ncbi:MAG TPA: tetratricopeptide repeat protein [Syntrophomonadaceae bacterium]|nr:tetratricopeptide repeat protein [Syntrophomonadaceae bacterium]HPR94594.1 tetratricopeptide repeat protein [Syntrophomonadaceae bacterium]
MDNIVKWHSQGIFISSTFRDMHAERGYLQDIVFPELEKRLRESAYPYHIEPIDLRWGVETAGLNEQQQKETEVLKVCLNEIERSRPFMIVLLGDRYGWVPPAVNIKRAIEGTGYSCDINGRSVTALEIEYGILNSLAEYKRCFFYFRNPLPYENMPANTAARYSDRYNPDEQASYPKLQALKQRIKETGHGPVREYWADWNQSDQEVSGLEAFGDLVTEDLWQAIQEECRRTIEEQPRTWQEEEQWLLEQYIENRYPYYHSASLIQQQMAASIRQQAVQSLKDFLLSPPGSGTARGICLAGEPGAGKSTLFARLCREMQQEDVLILAHAGGIGSRAGNSQTMLRLWIQAMNKFLGLKDTSDSLDTRKETEDTFAELLSRSAVKKRVIVMIDALNEFQDSQAKYLTWLPEIWPNNARLLITTITGAEPKVRNLEIKYLAALTKNEATAVCQVICSRYHKTLNSQVEKIILSHKHNDQPSYGNPLWIQLAINEILTLDEDDYARLEKDELQGTAEARLLSMLLDTAQKLPPDVPGLYQSLTEKLENLFGASQVKSLLSLIAVSRMGLRESDLKQLVPVMTGEAWQDLTFARIRNYLGSHLVQRGTENLWNFFHQQAKISVMNRYLKNEADLKNLHAVIAAYLETLTRQDPLRINEIMYHYIHADDKLKAAKYYGAYDLNDQEIQGAAQALASHIINNSHDEALEWVCSLLQSPLSADEICIIANHNNAYLLTYLEHFVSLADQTVLLNTAKTALIKIVDEHSDNLIYRRNLSVSYDRLGRAEATRGNWAGARQYYQNSLEIRKELAKLYPDNAEYRRELFVSYDRLGEVEETRGNWEGAMQYYQDSLKIIKELVRLYPDNTQYKRDLYISCQKMGGVAEPRGNWEGARQYYQDSLEMIKELVNLFPDSTQYNQDLSIGYNRLANVEETRGNWEIARVYYGDSLEITKELVRFFPENARFKWDLSINYINLGNVEATRGNWERAQQYYQDSLKIKKELVSLFPENVQYKRDLSVGYNKLANVEENRNKWEKVRLYFQNILEITEELISLSPENVQYKQDLSVGYNKLANVEEIRGNWDRARQYYEESLKIVKELVRISPENARYKRDLFVSYIRLGGVEENRCNWEGARQYYEESLEMVKEQVRISPEFTQYKRDLFVSYIRLGGVEENRGNWEGARQYYQDSLEITEELVNLSPETAQFKLDLSTTQVRLGNVEERQGNWEKARVYYQESLQITKELISISPETTQLKRDLFVSYIRLGGVEENRCNWEGARQYFKDSLETIKELVSLFPESAQLKRDLFVSYIRLGGVEKRQGNLEMTRQYYHDSLEIVKELVSLFPESSQYRGDLSIICDKMKEVE